MRLPTNRSNHCGIPRTKVERTTSLRLIHTYGVEDPAGLRHPELGASGVERREEQHFKAMEIGSNEREREGAALRGRSNLNCASRGASTSSIYRGMGRRAILEEGAALGLRPRVPSCLGRRQGGGGSFLEAPPAALPSWALLAQVLPPHLGLPSEREPIDII